jgi:anthranilate synthase component 1
VPAIEQESKFIKGVKQSRDYIVAGDVFQVNLSRQWQCKLTADVEPTQVYRALKKSNPAPSQIKQHNVLCLLLRVID